MKKILLMIFSICLLINGIQFKSAAADKSYSWYCKRVSNNIQPPLPSEFEFINNYSTIWIDNNNIKKVYLTFDAGYENGNVEKILDVLKTKNVPGTFFILQNLVKTNPELVKRMSGEGHLICNHTANHKNMSKITDIASFKKELDILNNSYYELTGTQMSKYYRPPEGSFSEKNLQLAEELGYTTVFWSLAYADWDNSAQPSYEYAKKKILDNIHPGAVILLHPTSATNASILPDVIDEISSMGYEFGRIDEIKN